MMLIPTKQQRFRQGYLNWIVLLTGILLMPFQAFATHVVGADLTYTCVNASTNTYQITLRFYRDCGGVAAPASPQVTIAGATGCSATTTTLTLSQTNVQEVSQVCAGTQTTCGGGSVQGTQEYVYTAQVVLPSGCNNYKISYEECDRNSAITNLVNAGNQCLYVETNINTNLAACNNSPQFNNVPVLYSCQNQVTQFNHGVFDADGDSLSFSLINPQSTAGTNIAFVTGLSATTPLELATSTTFQFNSANGQMTFTPKANTQQVAVISVRIDEYRNGVQIGSMIRDLQMIISSSCTSNPPASGTITPSTGSVTGSTIAACGSTAPLTIDFNVSDPDVADVLTASSDISSVIAGATISVSGTNPIIITLSIPTAGLASGNYPFTITVNDGACPTPNVQIIGYSLQITNPPPVVTVNASASTICQGEPVTLTASGANSYNWDNGVTNGIAFNPSSTNTYTVIGTASNGCTDTSSVTVNVNALPNVSANTTATTLCNGESVTLSGSGANNYSWNNGVNDGIAFSPSSTNTYTVTGTDANGCSNTDQVTITVNALPNVVANANSISLCQGQSLTLSGSGANSYTWDNGVTNGVAFNPTATNTYSVTGTDANGCENTDQITVSYNATPPPVASISAANNQICQGTTTVLTGVVNTGAGESIAWYYNGNLISGATAATYSASLDGNYYNVVTNSNGCTTQSSTETISYYQQPQAAITASASNFCGAGATITLTGGTFSGATYQWLDNGTPINGATQSNYTVSAPGSYQQVIISGDGCADTSVVFAPINAPTPQITISAGTNSFCTGSNLQLSATFEAGSTYEWFLNGNSITSPTLEDNTITISTAGNYTVEVTNSFGCTGTSNSFSISEQSLPTATITSTATDFCAGSSLDLSANFIAGATYEWFLNGNSLGTASLEDTSLTATSSGSYVVVINDGCENTSNSIMLTELNVPVAPGNISGNSDLCFGERETYSISPVSGATQYFWTISPAGAASISSGQGTTSVQVNSTNIDFQLNVVAGNACGSGPANSINVDMENGFLCPDVSFAANTTNICQGSSVVFSDYSNSNATFGLTAEWDFGVGASPATATGSGPHTVTYSSSGLKTVTLEYVDMFGTAFYTETYTDYINVQTTGNCTVGVDEIENTSTIEVYPNPTSDAVTVDLSDILSDATLELHTTQGQLIQRLNVQNELLTEVSLSDLPEGLYLLTIRTAKQQYTVKVVKK